MANNELWIILPILGEPSAQGHIISQTGIIAQGMICPDTGSNVSFSVVPNYMHQFKPASIKKLLPTKARLILEVWR